MRKSKYMSNQKRQLINIDSMIKMYLHLIYSALDSKALHLFFYSC